LPFFHHGRKNCHVRRIALRDAAAPHQTRLTPARDESSIGPSGDTLTRGGCNAKAAVERRSPQPKKAGRRA
jgi:hypothetical protein